ncbi:MAG TPA: hypothetical protein VLM79_15010, partial [Kofleriaceae bacterium]|nr:hypothetical protein [Kofleriaceae bacterium]
ELADLAAQLLAKRPDERPHSAVDVIALLDHWLSGAALRAPQGERVEMRGALGAGDGPRLAEGTSRRACIDTPPTEPMPRAVDAEGAIDAVEAAVRAWRMADARAQLALGS